MTSERAAPPRRRPRVEVLSQVAALVAVSLVLSCAYLDGSAGEPETHPLAFNHVVHAAAEIGCADCHAKLDDGKRGMPKLEFCNECHEDEENPQTREFLAALAKRPADARWVLFTPDPERIFTHAAHAEDCQACHGDVAALVATSRAKVAPSMASCVDCHERKAQDKTSCATCHRERRKDVAPPSHRQDWDREHGVQARFGGLTAPLKGECAYCHKRDTCLDCHRQVQPRSHNNFFRIRGHGLLASNDRQSCAACHQPDMCVRCHEHTRPQSHVGTWGTPRDQHCVSCHFPLQQEGCATCHKDTHSHGLAPARTPRHAPGLNCRQCHGAGTASLPHADNGTDCLACHR
ncbi:MAG: cytochrome c3 family protein [Planctomycetota bacterium]